jgi:elongation factor 1-beta
MGEVFLKYRIMPDGPETDLEALQTSIKGALPAFATMQNCESVPFAFGMKALVTGIVVEDEEGNSDKMEEVLSGIEGVQGVEMLEMGRL